jgi:hypothetical protein
MMTLIGTKFSESEQLYTAQYEIKHNTAHFKTILTADLNMSVREQTGEITAKIDIAPIQAANFEEMREKMAVHLERLAAGLREPIRKRYEFAVFDKDWEEIQRLDALKNPGKGEADDE